MTIPVASVLQSVFLLATIMAITGACVNGPKSMSIVTVEHPPRSLVVAGFEQDLGNQICARARIECFWTIGESANALSGLSAGDHDVLMGHVVITDEKSGQFLFTQPYLPSAHHSAAYQIGENSTLTPAVGGGEDALGIGAVVRESDCRLQGMLDQTIAEMKMDGSLNATIQRWFGTDGPVFQ